MKKQLLFTIVLITITLNLFSQNTKPKTTNQPKSPPTSVNPYEDTVFLNEAFRRQSTIYSLAMHYNDYDVATNALYNALLLDPKNLSILDTLALLYYQQGKYASAALVSKDIHLSDPDDLLAIEIAAISFENLGAKVQSLEFYEKLYLKKNDLNILYQVAQYQYELKRFEESKINLKIIIDNPNSNKFKLLFTNNNKQNEYSLTAGTYRLMAMIFNEQGNKEEAKSMFNKALEIEPNFDIVKKQIEELNKK